MSFASLYEKAMSGINIESESTQKQVQKSETALAQHVVEPVKTETKPRIGTLYWSNKDNNKEEQLRNSFKRLTKNNKSLASHYKSISSDIDTQINRLLADFFLENIPLTYFAANLSLVDKSKDKINLAVRVPNHGSFIDFLPQNASLSIRGYWPTKSRNPVFIPEDIFSTHNEEKAADYEIELEASASSLSSRASNNVLTSDLAEKLPTISVKTKEKLQDWFDFLKFKRSLIQEKTLGLRYVSAELNENNDLVFLIVGKTKEDFSKAEKVFSRKGLEAFELSVSSDKWEFKLDSEKLSRNIPRGEELGQIKGKIKLLDASQIKKLKLKVEDLEDSSVKTLVFGKITIDLTEDWKNKLDNIDKASTDNDDQEEFDELVEKLLSKVRTQGFISFPSVGDLALLKRHERSLKNLQQNESCFSPYLASYMFDIKAAKNMEASPCVTDWFNKRLNEAQKNAVIKMIGAPDLCLVQGPPGTGKTTVIAEAILQLAKNGETVLLASQSHDAIDNALSRIQNHPELRAIRLARSADKITPEGQRFASHQALGRYYDSLDAHVSNQHLEPLKEKQKNINTVKKWFENAKFVQHDLLKSQENFVQEKQKLNKLNECKNKLEKDFSTSLKKYSDDVKLHQDTKHLVSFINNKIDLILGEPHLPLCFDKLAEELFRLSDANVKLDFDLAQYISSPKSKVLIVQSLISNFNVVAKNIDDIKHDLVRLQSSDSSSLLDHHAQQEIIKLQKEEDIISGRMDDNDDPELAEQWRTIRKRIKTLKKQSVGLDFSIYKSFSDASVFTKLENTSETASLLSERLKIISSVRKNVETIKSEVIEHLELYLSDPITKPNCTELDSLKKQIIRQECSEQTAKKQREHHKTKQNSLSQEYKASSDISFDKKIDDAANFINELSEEIEIELSSPFNNFLEDWHTNLSESDVANSDWEHIQQNFTENCNLYAISCNESDRTLQNAGVESFDVAIIDEVSKATPVELLLPLMRARRAVLVGDHRQLPPMFQEGQDAEAFTDKVEKSQEEGESNLLTKDNIKRFEKVVTASLFKEHFENADPSIRERLTEQFRMHPQIMKLVNNFYEGQLIYGKSGKTHEHGISLKGKLNKLISHDDHILWVDTSLNQHNKPYKENEDRTNPLEAELIAKTLLQINEQCRSQGFNKKERKSVGVVSFYAAQCKVIRNAIKKSNNGNLQFDAIHVEINTVIRYQGKEKPIILMSLVRNDGLPKEKRRSARANVAKFEFINVAMSRAEDLLIVFGARNMLELRDVFLPNMDSTGVTKTQVYRNIFSYLDRSARIFPTYEMSDYLIAARNAK